MPAFQQILAQLLKVVNLPVEDDPDGSVLIANRLTPRAQIDDAQALHSQTDRTLDIDAFIVRTPMTDRPAHPRDQLGMHRPVSLEIQLATDTAHCLLDKRDR